MRKKLYYKLALINLVVTLCVLIVMPRVPIKFNKYGINVDSFLGGYILNLPGGKVLNLSNFKKGLDLEGGISLVLDAKMDDIKQSDRLSALESAKEVISRRVNLLGVSEPNVQTSRVGNSYRILVEIPGVADVDQAVKLVGQTAQLKFKALNGQQPWDENRYFEFYSNPSLWSESNINGSHLKGALVTFGQPQAGLQQPQVQLQFTNQGRKLFSALAKANVGKPIAIYLDEEQFPLSMAVVSNEFANGVAQDPVISGNFDIETATNLSLQIKAGALPVPVQILEQETIGPTLGQDSVRKSIVAGIIGLLLVFLFMTYAYGKKGFLSGIALVIYALITLAIFKLVPVVLTLPGIAGFILSIGVATDASVLIFSRIREEKRWGVPENLAIKYGFERAWTSIKDSNIASLISATILFYFGTGPIRGFALTLFIGIAISLFTTIFIVKTLVELFGYSKQKENEYIKA